MNYTELKDFIQNKIEGRAQQNYQFVMLRYLLLIGSATRTEIAKELQNYNQDDKNKDYRYAGDVYEVLSNPEKNLVSRMDDVFSLEQYGSLTNDQRYELVSLCDEKINLQRINKRFGTDPVMYNLTIKQAALKVLKEENRPLHYAIICNKILANHYYTTVGKTPDETLRRDLDEDIKHNAKSLFTKTDAGIFSLNFSNFKFIVLSDEKDIEQAQSNFIKTLNDSITKKGKITIGFPGPEEKVTDEVNYNSNAGIWWYTKTLKDAANPRYWNCFGIGEPLWGKNNGIVVEINPLVKGINRSISGAFVKDQDGDVYITHSGVIGGGNTPGGFYNVYPNQDKWILADDGKKELRDLILISNVSSSKLPSLVSEYIKEIAKYKSGDFAGIMKKSIQIDDAKFREGHRLFEQEILSRSDIPFINFDHPLLLKEEIDYKKEILQNALSVLALDKWDEWKDDSGKILQVVKAACSGKISKNLLMGPRFGPGTGSAAFLELSDPEQIKELENQLYNLFKGGSTNLTDFGTRFDSFINYLRTNGMKSDWRIMSYFAFLIDSKSYFPILPSQFDALLKFYGVNEKLSGDISWDKYLVLLGLAEVLKSKLSQYGKLDSIQIQSYMWIVSRLVQNVTDVQYWLIRPGTGGSDWDNQRNLGIIGIGFYEKIGDLNQFRGTNGNIDENKLRTTIAKYEERPGASARNFGQYRYFMSIKKGDKIVACEGMRRILGIGEATGHYEYMPELTHFHTQSVNWYDTRQREFSKGWQGTIMKITKDQFEEMVEEKPAKSAENKKFEEFSTLLEKKNQLIFYGPPGTGKTFMANEFAEWFVSKNQYSEERFNNEIVAFTNTPFIKRITFHPSYSYEEFVEGIKIRSKGDGVEYYIEDGVFKEICDQARTDKKKNRYVLIIDEINRGNISKILGELITLIESDKRDSNELLLTYSKKPFTVPGNLYIIGTMNTADRSLTLLDVALRRRFVFYELLPDSSLLDESVMGIHLGKLLDGLNQKIRDQGFREKQLGHSFFMNKGNPITKIEDLVFVFANEIIPLLQEYFYEEYDKLQEILGPTFVDEKELKIKDEWKNDNKLFVEALKPFVSK